MDLTDSITPRSDQLNAEDMLSGPRTVTIVEVSEGASAEQPVNIVLAEFGPERPFKPSKTVRRLLVAAWGPDTSVYAGRRMVIYRDPTVRFGGQDVGGIRLSHLSHIEKPLTIALTVTRGRRKTYNVEPLPNVTELPRPITPEHEKIIGSQMLRAGVDAPTVLAIAREVAGRDVKKSRELSAAEADAVIERLAALPDAPEEA